MLGCIQPMSCATAGVSVTATTANDARLPSQRALIMFTVSIPPRRLAEMGWQQAPKCDCADRQVSRYEPCWCRGRAVHARGGRVKSSTRRRRRAVFRPTACVGVRLEEMWFCCLCKFGSNASRIFERPPKVVDGISPNTVRYTTANRPSSENPYCLATAAMLVVAGSACRNAARTRLSRRSRAQLPGLMPRNSVQHTLKVRSATLVAARTSAMESGRHAMRGHLRSGP